MADTTTSNVSHSINEEENNETIQELINKLLHHRQAYQLKEADQLKKLLFHRHSIQIFYRRNGSIGWRYICNDAKEQINNNALSHRDCGKRVVWSLVVGKGPCCGETDNAATHPLCGGCRQDDNHHDDGVPIFIVTVDTPYYRGRLAETMEHLSNPSNSSFRTTDDVDVTRRFYPIHVIDLLILEEHQSLGTNRILYEGWRRILLPKILSDGDGGDKRSKRLILVGEDDVRLAASPSFIEKVCLEAFDSNPDLHILSLGHGYSPAKLSRRQRSHARAGQQEEEEEQQQQEQSESSWKDVNDEDDRQPSIMFHARTSSCPILDHLERGKGIHGTTLMAIRYPEGVTSLMETMESIPLRKRGTMCDQQIDYKRRRKNEILLHLNNSLFSPTHFVLLDEPGHFDQFLFHSKLHNLAIAVSDPPLVGWAEVTYTLTSNGSGNRRRGGGRLEQLPHVTNFDVKWVRRYLM